MTTQTQIPPDASEEALNEDALGAELDVAFSPLHKRCLGIAVGVVTGLVILALTLVHLVRSPEEPYPLILLEQYFPGYSVSVIGALVGMAWGFWIGFVVGWFFAFCRNATLSLTAILFRTRAELAENRGFLDHI